MRFLTWACALAALLLLALVSSIWFLRAAGLPQDRTPVVIELAGQSLRIDPAFVRRRNDLLHRQHEEFELVAVWPNLAPAAHILARVPAEDIIVLALRGKHQRLEPAEKPARLYARFLKEDEEPFGDGLVARRFEVGSPYEGEVLIMTPPEGRLFWARCSLRNTGATQMCLGEIRIDGFDVKLRVNENILSQWESVTQRLTQLLATLRPNQ